MSLGRRGTAALLFALLASPGALAQDSLEFGLDLTPEARGRPRPAPAPKPKTRLQLILPAAPGEGTEAKGAIVLLDDQPLGPSPVDGWVVKPGDHTLVIRRLGFATWTQAIVLKPGRVNSVTATLEPESEVVTFASQPGGAVVSIDGQIIGQTPLDDVVVAPGKHEIQFDKEGYEPWSTSVEAVAGKRSTVSSALAIAGTPPIGPSERPSDRPTQAWLEPGERDPDMPFEPEPFPRTVSSPSKSRWYLWVGAGVLAAAAAGVAVAVVAGQSHGGPPTAMGPSDVCKGPCDIVLNAPP